MAPGKAKDGGLSFDVSVNNCKATQVRRPATGFEKEIEKPSLPRANMAVLSNNSSRDAREYSEKLKDYTVLEQHILFWDRQWNGKIAPWDTYNGFRDLGFNIVFSALAALVINITFSYPTRLTHSWFPDPLFRIYVDSIHKTKVCTMSKECRHDPLLPELDSSGTYMPAMLQHGSDTGVIDNEGRFVPQIFQNMFAKYDKEGDGTLCLREMFDMLSGQRVAVDPFGWTAAVLEWCTTWLILQKEGKIYKQDLRQGYDGSIFWRIRDARQKEGWNQGFGISGDGFLGSVET